MHHSRLCYCFHNVPCARISALHARRDADGSIYWHWMLVRFYESVDKHCVRARSGFLFCFPYEHMYASLIQYNEISHYFNTDCVIFIGTSTEPTSYEDTEIFNDFNTMFWKSRHHIVKRTCVGCTTTHKEIFYKRLTNVDTFDVASVMYQTWTSGNNLIGTDFQLYSTFEDALEDTNPWTFCNYDEDGTGFPRECGPSGRARNQWNSLTKNGRNVTYSIADDCGILIRCHF